MRRRSALNLSNAAITLSRIGSATGPLQVNTMRLGSSRTANFGLSMKGFLPELELAAASAPQQTPNTTPSNLRSDMDILRRFRVRRFARFARPAWSRHALEVLQVHRAESDEPVHPCSAPATSGSPRR